MKIFSRLDQNQLEEEAEEIGGGDLGAVVERPVLTTDATVTLIYLLLPVLAVTGDEEVTPHHAECVEGTVWAEEMVSVLGVETDLHWISRFSGLV